MISDRTPIYRYMSFQRFYEMIFTSQLTLVSPSKWPDQYEQLLLKTISTSKGQQMLIEEATQYTGNTKKAAKKIRELATVITNSTYCLCFSTEKDAEVMWNAYSDNKQAIMIETSREKIDAILFELNHCVKEVKYDLKQNETAKDLLTLFLWDPFMTAIVDQDELFLHKRTIFEYEHEVRLIAYQHERNNTGILSIDIPSISDFITGVMVHPTANSSFVSMIELLCKEKKINFYGKSKVYDFIEE